MNDGFPGEDRREGERRDPPPPTHVTIDSFANGGRMLIETLIEETRANQRELQSTRSSIAKWLAGAALTVAVVVGTGLWNLSGKIGSMTTEIDRRPTSGATLRMIDSAAVLRAAKEQATVQILTEQHGQMEALKVRVESLSTELGKIGEDHDTLFRRNRP
jgi:hypothetical protein